MHIWNMVDLFLSKRQYSALQHNHLRKIPILGILHIVFIFAL
jgi:hypothetical protein